RQPAEAVLGRRRGGCDLDIGDPGERRAAAAGFDHAVDLRLRTGDQRLDIAVLQIADPAVEAEGARFIRRPVSVADTLDAALDQETDSARACHQLTRIPG